MVSQVTAVGGRSIGPFLVQEHAPLLVTHSSHQDPLHLTHRRVFFRRAIVGRKGPGKIAGVRREHFGDVRVRGEVVVARQRPEHLVGRPNRSDGWFAVGGEGRVHFKDNFRGRKKGTGCLPCQW